MSAPLTLWEESGKWSTRDSEAAFFHQIAEDTSLTVVEAGRSVLDHQIWRVDLGNPDGLPVMLLGAQHGSELATREAGLMWIRDLAYSDDPDVLEFLDLVHIVMVSPVNADGIEPPTSRNNKQGINLNRDWYTLQSPELQATMRVVTDVAPALLIDLHEWSTSLDITLAWAAGGTDLRPVHPLIDQAGRDIMNAAITEINTAGYITHQYPVPAPTDTAQGTSRSASGDLHCAGILIETKYGAPQHDRVDSTSIFLDTVRVWLTMNHAQLAAAQAASRAAAVAGESDAWVVSITDENGRGPWQQITVPESYSIPEGVLIPDELFEIYGIEYSGRTVSTLQPARAFIANLLDPRSADNIYRKPWHGPTPDPEGEGAPSAPLLMVKRDGVRYPVQQMVIKRDGIRYPVRQLVAKTGGVRRIVGG